ncbi:MAG: hypothetical protein PHU54_02670 [Candidatus Omnitrophica bacterium]|nr:hypothetical protein [Candidatus Omnitrophota bacterium]
MSQHTKIKQLLVTIASTFTTGLNTVDMELSTEDMRKMEQDYNLGAGLWYTRLIPVVNKVSDITSIGGALEKPLVGISIPNPAFPSVVQVKLDVVAPVGTHDAIYAVSLIYPHSIVR